MREIIIYDDFFADPDKVRAEVIQKGFQEMPGSKTYPGKMSEPYVTPEMYSLFASLIGADMRNLPPGSWFGHFRLSLEADPFEQWIHMDPVPWSAIVYLNPDGTYPEGFGTAFWKHKETGWNKYPAGYITGPANQEMLSKGYRDYQDLRQKVIYRDGLDESKWTQELFVPGKYNRMVLFRPTLFHSHMPKFNFGTDEQSGRLVQLFFFDEVRL